MKKVFITLSLIPTLFTYCASATGKNERSVPATEAGSLTAIPAEAAGDNEEEKTGFPGELSELLPVDVLDSSAASAYDKYGIEFSGNCYACDLARLSVTWYKMTWTNVCDENDTFESDVLSFSQQGNKTILKTGERTYVLILIDQAPVYELLVEGDKLELNNKRIAAYFTTRQALPLFKEHDCGDFDG